MTDFVRLGVFGEGRFLKAKTFASGMDIFPFVHTTPKKSTVSLAMFILAGRIFNPCIFNRIRTCSNFIKCSCKVVFVANIMSSA